MRLNLILPKSHWLLSLIAFVNLFAFSEAVSLLFSLKSIKTVSAAKALMPLSL